MNQLFSRILQLAQELGANPGMDYFRLLQIVIDLRSKKECEIIPTAVEVLQHIQGNCTPDVAEQIFNSATTILQTQTNELNCQGHQMTFGEIMEAFREQPLPSHDPEELPPTFGLPRIILTFELWDIVVHLHRFHMQMLAPAIGNFTPVPPAVDW